MTRASRGLSRERILDQLRLQPATIDQLAATLGISRGAVRLQLATLERDGLVARRGTHRGATKPSAMYEITARGQVSLSRGYVPMLTRLLHVLAQRLPQEQFDGIMQEVGRAMLDGRQRPTGSLEERVRQASALFNELGGLTDVERGDRELLIHSHGCPFAATTERQPAACMAVECLFAEFIGAPVSSCCEREGRLKCCFAVALRGAGPTEALA